MNTEVFQGIFQLASCQFDETKLEKYERLLSMDVKDQDFDQIIEEFFDNIISIIIYEKFYFKEDHKFFQYYDHYYDQLCNFINFPTRTFFTEEMKKSNNSLLVLNAKLNWCRLYFGLKIQPNSVEKNYWFYEKLSYRLFDNYNYFENKKQSNFIDFFNLIRDDFLKQIKSICAEIHQKNFRKMIKMMNIS